MSNSEDNAGESGGKAVDDTRHLAVQMLIEVTGGGMEEATFFLKCAGWDIQRAINIFYDEPDRFTREPKLPKPESTPPPRWSQRQSRSFRREREMSAGSTGSIGSEMLDFDAPIISRDLSTTSSTTAHSGTSAGSARSDSSIGFTAGSNDTPTTSDCLPDEDLLELSKGFFRLNQVLAMCCFLDGKTLRSCDIKPLRDHLHAATGITVSAKRIKKIIIENRAEVIAASKWRDDGQASASQGSGAVANNSSENRQSSECRTSPLIRRQLSDHLKFDDPSSSLRKYPRQYWSSLPSVLLAPELRAVTGLCEEDLRIVVAFLQLGNLSNPDGSVRRYSDLELLSPPIGKPLQDCRQHITTYVKAVVRLLLNHGELLELRRKVELGELSLESPSSAAMHFDALSSCTPTISPGGPSVIDSEFAEEYLLMKSLKSLLGNRTWNIHGQNEAVFQWVNDQAQKKLSAIALDGERRIFPRIRGAFSDGIFVPPERTHRLDDPGMLPFKTALKGPLSSVIGGIPPHDDEFLVILEYLAQLVDPFLQREAHDLCVSCGGSWRGAPPKTCARMKGKLTVDHKNETEPKAAANLDMARCALTFANPDDLKGCYNLCDGGGSRVLKLLRVKNNFLESYDASESFGYRSILANYSLELPNCTWGNLFDADKQEDETFDPGLGVAGSRLYGEVSPQSGDDHGIGGFLPQFFRIGQVVVVEAAPTSMRREKFAKVSGFGSNGRVLLHYGSDGSSSHSRRMRRPGPASMSVPDLIALNKASCTAALQQWRVPQSIRHVPDLTSLVVRLQSTLFANEKFRAAPVRFIVEIQFLLTEYLRMRKRSHVWYKLQRSETMEGTVSDFYQYAGIWRGTSLLLQALVAEDVETVDYFAKFESHADGRNQFNNEVLGCRDPVTGFTVLHFVAARADGRFNNLLRPVLVIRSGILVTIPNICSHTSVCNLAGLTEF